MCVAVCVCVSVCVCVCQCVVERKVSVQLPPPPQKEPRIIELEVMISIFDGLPVVANMGLKKARA